MRHTWPGWRGRDRQPASAGPNGPDLCAFARPNQPRCGTVVRGRSEPGTRRARQAVRRSGRLRSLKPGTPQFTFVMGLVFLFAGLAELAGVLYGAPAAGPHGANHGAWI